MIEQADVAAIRSGAPRRAVGIALAGVVVLAAIAGFAGAPYVFNVKTLQSEVAKQVGATTGLTISSRNDFALELLPRPHVVTTDLHVTDASGTLSIDADRIDGDLRLLPLVFGYLDLASVTLYKPKLTINLDARPVLSDSIIGRAMHANETSQLTSETRLGTVTLVDGSITLKSKTLAHLPSFDAINLTIDWRNLEASATLTGSLSVQKTATDVAIWVAEPANLMRGDPSAMTLRLHSAPADIAANGDLVGGATSSSFRGRASVSAPSLAAVLALAGFNAKLPATFGSLALDSDATIGVDRDGKTEADLPNLHLRLDGNEYEGSLSFQGGTRPLLSGTLACDQLVLTPFLYQSPVLVGTDREWTRTPFSIARIDPLGLDLRISAAHLRIAPITIDDAALAVMTRERRTEVGLVGGKAYGGTVRGRLSFGAADKMLDVRGFGSLTDVDVSGLSWDLFGRQLAAGTLSGSANLETTGDNPSALMEHLQGWVKGRTVDGEIDGADLGRSLREVARQKFDAVLPALSYGRTTFGNLAFALRINDGIAVLDDVSMQGDDSKLSLSGKADIGNRLLDLHANLSAPDASMPSALRFDIDGSFDKVIIEPDASVKP